MSKSLSIIINKTFPSHFSFMITIHSSRSLKRLQDLHIKNCVRSSSEQSMTHVYVVLTNCHHVLFFTESNLQRLCIQSNPQINQFKIYKYKHNIYIYRERTKCQHACAPNIINLLVSSTLITIKFELWQVLQTTILYFELRKTRGEPQVPNDEIYWAIQMDPSPFFSSFLICTL